MDNTYICDECKCIFRVKDITGDKCINCGGSITETDNYDYKDYSILPFNYSLEDAKKIYRKKIRFNFLLPIIYRKKSTISNIKKIYVPCYLYDVNVNGKISFYGVDRIKNINNVPDQKFEVLHDVDVNYNNLLVSGVDIITDEIISSINDYKFDEIKDYNEEDINNTYLLTMNKNEKDIKEFIKTKANNNVLNIVKSNVEHELKKLNTNESKVKISNSRKVLVPIYSLNIKYKDNDYIFYMNGNTGKETIDYVSSRLSMIIFFIIVFIIVFILSIIISFLL